MESFYGGRPGNPFILKGVKQEGQTSEFEDLTDIQEAINNGNLKYGEYAIISSLGSASTETGKIYRVNENNQPIYMGRIVAPAINLSGNGNSGIRMVDPSILGAPRLTLTNENDQTITVDVEVPWTSPTINIDSAGGYLLKYEGNHPGAYYRPWIKLETPPPVYIGKEYFDTYQIISEDEDSHLYPDNNNNNDIYPNPAAGSIIFIVEDNSNSDDLSQS
jgi:hypothetical protein